MEAGRTPDTVVVDEPLTIGNWSPQNYEAGYRGPLTLEQALARSVNTVAARLANEVGRGPAWRRACAGITSPINTDPAMALGTTLVTPLEMARAYDAFANGGTASRPMGSSASAPPAARSSSATEARPRRPPNLATNSIMPGTGRVRHYRYGLPFLELRPRRQDRHHLRLQGRLVLRLHRRAHHRGLARPRRRQAHGPRHRRKRAGGAGRRFDECGAAAPPDRPDPCLSRAAPVPEPVPSPAPAEPS